MAQNVDHHDEYKEPATPGQVLLTILGGAFPVALALYLVYRYVSGFQF